MFGMLSMYSMFLIRFNRSKLPSFPVGKRLSDFSTKPPLHKLMRTFSIQSTLNKSNICNLSAILCTLNISSILKMLSVYSMFLVRFNRLKLPLFSVGRRLPHFTAKLPNGSYPALKKYPNTVRI